MRQLCILLLGVLVSGLACEESRPEHFQVTDKGLHYKFHIQNHDIQPEIGDQVTFSMTIRKGQKVLNSSYQRGRHENRLVPLHVKKNPIYQAFKLMGLGDSITLALFVDSLPRRMTFGFGAGDTMLMDIRIFNIKPKHDLDQEYAALTTKAENVTKDIQRYIKLYRKGLLETQTTESGLNYVIHKKGRGLHPKRGHTVQVHYAGYLINGQSFSSSFDLRRRPARIRLGNNQIIRGWEEGLTLMQSGGSATLFVPPHLAYGEKGYAPRIPKNAELVIYVELLNVY